MKWYARSHEWAEVNSSGVIEIGISDHAQHALGDIVYVSFPSVGEHVLAKERFGDVESVKAVSELFSPVDGEVLEVNEELLDAPEKLNQAPLSTWILRVKGTLVESELLSEEAYLESLK